MADAIDKTKETYQKGKDVVNKADDLKWKTENTASDVKNTTEKATGFIGWIKGLFGMK